MHIYRVTIITKQMDKLRQVVSDKQRQQDPSWCSLYNTDLRNLHPKHELSKIQKSKIKYDKFRLIMENIDDFLCLEQHRRDVRNQVHSLDDIKKELEEINQHKHSQMADAEGYHTDILGMREHAEQLAGELNNYMGEIGNKTTHRNSQLSAFIQGNSKWEQYVKENSIQPAEQAHKHKLEEQVQLARTVEIPCAYDQLNDSTCSQILCNRLRSSEKQRQLLASWTGKSQKNQPIFGDARTIAKSVQWQAYI